MLVIEMSDALYLDPERQQSKSITIISAGVAANCHTHCYENTPLHRLSRYQTLHANHVLCNKNIVLSENIGYCLNLSAVPLPSL